ncbi:MAG TPA: carboxypeptidase regulatory-like domain-containing protein [Gemmatimonadaceae bacterium]|nr:carboxypeptidase regulatory-like domain-containing protein [Gemmatimonadaceae bacterium]
MISASTLACSDPVWPDVDVELRGTVTDAATLAAMPGATVRLYRADGFSRATQLGATTTDAAGNYVLRVRVDRCTPTIIALAVSANGYIDALRGYVGEPLDRNPQCRSEPQTFDLALQARNG